MTDCCECGGNCCDIKSYYEILKKRLHFASHKYLTVNPECEYFKGQYFHALNKIKKYRKDFDIPPTW